MGANARHASARSRSAPDGYLNGTTVHERNLWVVTHWLPEYGIAPSTWIVPFNPPGRTALWTKEYRAPVSRGGLEEAHYCVVDLVRTGRLP